MLSSICVDVIFIFGGEEPQSPTTRRCTVGTHMNLALWQFSLRSCLIWSGMLIVIIMLIFCILLDLEKHLSGTYLKINHLSKHDHNH